MNIERRDIHICDDWISCRLHNLQAVHAANRAVAARSQWREVVSGLDSLAVQFDPAKLEPNQAAGLLLEQLKQSKAVTFQPPPLVTLPICYDADFAPDREKIAEKLALEPEALPDWHSSLEFSVTMLGFMPGFAYLMCENSVPDIGRLARPRQNISAGSVGIIGNQTCLYSFDSPGGWPIIGRIPIKLFDPASNRPALLTAGQPVSFTPIDRELFEDISAGKTQWP